MEEQEFHKIEKVSININLATWTKTKITTLNIGSSKAIIEKSGL